MSAWTKTITGTWRTQDGLWTAQSRWDSTQLDHWVLLVGGDTGPQIASRKTLREIKKLVAAGETDRHIAWIERDYESLLTALRDKLAAAPTDPGRQHIARRITADIERTQRNLTRLRQAVTNQGDKA